MVFGWREALAAVAALFLGFLLVKLRPVSRSRVLSAEVTAARMRARTAATPRLRASALCEAGEISAKQGQRGAAAAGYFMRAMKADPASVEIVERTANALLRQRPGLLEKLLWRRLAAVPWDEAHLPAARSMALGLGRVYGRSLRNKARAEVLRRLAQRLEA
jgi:hypothetical protein